MENRTPEAVAYMLLQGIAQHEGKKLHATESGVVVAEKQWLLDAYRDCIEAVRHGKSPYTP